MEQPTRCADRVRRVAPYYRPDSMITVVVVVDKYTAPDAQLRRCARFGLYLTRTNPLYEDSTVPPPPLRRRAERAEKPRA